MKTANVLLFGIAIVISLKTIAQESENRWIPNWDNLNEHEAPEWLLDAKLGIQYVGELKDFNDQDYWQWSRAQQRARILAADNNYESVEEYDKKAKNLGVDYIWPVEYPDSKKAISKYVEVGAKYLVSMQGAVILTTEGLMMTPAEIAEARKQGLKVGLHFNFQRWGGIPAIGDPGYVNWMIPWLKNAIMKSESDFMFFDGKQMPSQYLKTAELVAWYYNWADKNGKEVWVNEDLGNEFTHFDSPADVVGFECGTTTGVSERPWVNWDNLRNEWNCWVNEYGVHVRTGGVWKWRYKATDDLLHMFIDAVSKGGGWLIQMVNTKEAWQTLEPIGEWLKINGEAIYNTRPYLPVDTNAKVVPLGSEVARLGSFPNISQDWWDKWNSVYKEATSKGPMYFNKSKDGKTLYCIHWGWPGKSLLVRDVKPFKGSNIYMLGEEQNLSWKQINNDIIIYLKNVKPCDYAYSFKIELKK